MGSTAASGPVKASAASIFPAATAPIIAPERKPAAASKLGATASRPPLRSAARRAKVASPSPGMVLAGYSVGIRHTIRGLSADAAGASARAGLRPSPHAQVRIAATGHASSFVGPPRRSCRAFTRGGPKRQSDCRGPVRRHSRIVPPWPDEAARRSGSRETMTP